MFKVVTNVWYGYHTEDGAGPGVPVDPDLYDVKTHRDLKRVKGTIRIRTRGKSQIISFERFTDADRAELAWALQRVAGGAMPEDLRTGSSIRNFLSWVHPVSGRDLAFPPELSDLIRRVLDPIRTGGAPLPEEREPLELKLPDGDEIMEFDLSNAAQGHRDQKLDRLPDAGVVETLTEAGRRAANAARAIAGRAAEITSDLLVQAFGWLGVGDGEGEPEWLEFAVPSGEYLTKLPRRLQNAVDSGRIKVPDGSCAWVALAASGCKQSQVGTNPGEWVGARVYQMVEWLDAHGYGYHFHDATGRVVLVKEAKNGSLPKRFLVANGHVRAFKARNAKPENVFRLRPTEGGIKELPLIEARYSLRGTNSVEVAAFYNGCGLRAPLWRAPVTDTATWKIDLVSAYPSIIMDDRCVFPVPKGTELVKTYDSPVPKFPSEMDPHGFYRVWVEDEVERQIMGSGEELVWVLGEVAENLWPETELLVSGEYVARDHVTGGPLGSDLPRKCKKDEASAEIWAKMVGDQKKKNCALRSYSGWIEAESSQKTAGVLPYTHHRESVYLNGAAKLHREHEIGHSELGYGLTVTRVYRKTGRLAKLAIYSYTACRLVRAWRVIAEEDPDASLLAVHTDSLSVDTTASPDSIVERVKSVCGVEFRVEDRGRHVVEPFARPVTRITSSVSPGVQRGRGERDVTAENVELNLRLLVTGPPGVGKSFWLRETYLPALERAGIRHVAVTPVGTLAEASGGLYGVLQTCLLKSGLCAGAVSEWVRDKVVVLDEVGLAGPEAIRQLALLNPRGIVLIGDAGQLTGVGDLERIASRLRLKRLKFGYHEKDRYRGDKEKMYRVLNHLEAEIVRHDASEAYWSDPTMPGVWRRGLLEELADMGVKVVQAPGGEGLCLGWRRKLSVDHPELEGRAMTVAGYQGRTIDEKTYGTPVTYITDFACGPRLLYTAISRSRDIDDVRLVDPNGKWVKAALSVAAPAAAEP